MSRNLEDWFGEASTEHTLLSDESAQYPSIIHKSSHNTRFFQLLES